MHLAEYAVLPPPMNAQARAALAHVSAPAIAFGSPLDNDLLERARVEYKWRKLYHSLRLVTDDELLHARLRYVALLHEYAAHAYPPAPQSALAHIARLCAQLADEPLDNLPAAGEALAAVRAALDRLRLALDDEYEPPTKKEKTEPPAAQQQTTKKKTETRRRRRE